MSEKIKLKSKKEFRDSFPKLVVYIGIAILIYLFSYYVFIPLSDERFIGNISVTQLVSIIGIIAILVLVIKSLNEIKDISNAIGGFISITFGKGELDEGEVEHYQMAVRRIIYVFAVVIGFMFIGSLLSKFSESATGILLICVFLWSIYMLYSAGMAISKETEASANVLVNQVEKRFPGMNSDDKKDE